MPGIPVTPTIKLISHKNLAMEMRNILGQSDVVYDLFPFIAHVAATSVHVRLITHQHARYKLA
eukprot:320981-Karenia_brevis.AAC.1